MFWSFRSSHMSLIRSAQKKDLLYFVFHKIHRICWHGVFASDLKEIRSLRYKTEYQMYEMFALFCHCGSYRPLLSPLVTAWERWVWCVWPLTCTEVTCPQRLGPGQWKWRKLTQDRGFDQALIFWLLMYSVWMWSTTFPSYEYIALHDTLSET